jgi:hypothetical protein
MDSTRPTSRVVQTALILLFITAHSFLMNGFSHVNRYLTVGLYVDPISAKIDPSLFRNSLYVQSVEGKKARLSLMHNLSPSIFRHADLETFAIAQWLICLFFTTVVLFYLGKILAGTDLAGYVTALLFTGKLNDWTLGSPAVYINFFHHGLQWALMLNILSLALIFRKKYIWACFLMGAAWNFHPMSVLFLQALLFAHWLVHAREYGFKTLLACGAAFVCAALPMLTQSLDYARINWEYGPEWLRGVRWTVWYTVFPSTWPAFYFFRAGLYFWLFLMGLSTLPPGRKRSDLMLFVGVIGILCAAGTIFAELIPVPSIIKMSLWRSSWLYMTLSLPCLAHLCITIWDRSFLRRFLIIATLILITGCIHSIPYYYLLLFNIIFMVLLLQSRLEKRCAWLYRHLLVIFFVLLSFFLIYQGLFDHGIRAVAIGLVATGAFLLLLSALENNLPRLQSRRSFIPIALLFVVFLDGGSLWHRGGPDIYYHGYRKGEKDPWADVQMFAQQNTPKDALFIIPPYLNDFGIYSKRATLGDWAEGSSIIYLDNDYAQQWLERMKDLGWKTIWDAETGYNSLATEAIVAAAKKYNAPYVVTEKPKSFSLPVMYENSEFILYEVPLTINDKS